MMPDIETGKNRANSAAREFHDPGDMRGCVYGNLRPVFRLAGDGRLTLWTSRVFFCGTHFRNAESLFVSSYSLHIIVRASDDLQVIIEVVRFVINGADVAASDDAKGRFSVHTRNKTSFLPMRCV